MEAIQDVLAIIGALASIAGVTLTIIYTLQRRRSRRLPTWEDAFAVARKLLGDVESSGWKPDLVIGLGRSGGIWGGWLAGNLGSLRFIATDILYDDSSWVRKITFPGAIQVLNAAQEILSGSVNVLLVALHAQ